MLWGTEETFNLGWVVVQVQINKGFLEVTLKLNRKG